jgi:uncharacterized damage-inducible protein DinB
VNNKLKLLYQQLEDDRTRLMAELSKASGDTLSLKPSKDKWSVNEILTHLLTSEQLTIRYLKKKSLGIEQLRNSGLAEKIRYAVLEISQRLPLKFKAPKHVVPVDTIGRAPNGKVDYKRLKSYAMAQLGLD